MIRLKSIKVISNIANKWQKLAAGISTRTIFSGPAKGHFVVYSTDNRRFEVPLGYLSSEIFMELFRMSEEEFGLPRNGPITLPCDAVFMEYAMWVVRRNVCKELERAVLVALASCRFSACFCG